jgi:hypothetical protein
VIVRSVNRILDHHCLNFLVLQAIFVSDWLKPKNVLLRNQNSNLFVTLNVHIRMIQTQIVKRKFKESLQTDRLIDGQWIPSNCSSHVSLSQRI